MRVGVQQPGPGRAGEQELAGSGAPSASRSLLGARRDDRGQRARPRPTRVTRTCGVCGDDVAGRRTSGRPRTPRRTRAATRPRACSRAPRRSASLQLVEQRLDVHARGSSGPNTRPTRAIWSRSADQRLAGARVLHLDRDLAAVRPDGPVHLADRRGGGRDVVERLEPAPPPAARARRRAPCARSRPASAERRPAAWSACAR